VIAKFADDTHVIVNVSTAQSYSCERELTHVNLD